MSNTIVRIDAAPAGLLPPASPLDSTQYNSDEIDSGTGGGPRGPHREPDFLWSKQCVLNPTQIPAPKMQSPAKNPWVILPLAFSMFIYAAYGLSQFDGEATILQWTAGIGALTISMLMLFQSVKGLMQDMTWKENFPDEK